MARIFTDRCYAAVEADPTKSVFQIWKDVRTDMGQHLTSENRESFLSEIPKLHPWSQVAIISVEISEECWIPVAFGLLPDKKRDTYDTFLGLLKTALTSHNLGLSARTVMSDFEVGIEYRI